MSFSFLRFTRRLLVAAFVFIALVSMAPAADDDGYRLGVGDRIGISVIGEPDLTREMLIDHEGAISYPFLGTLKVAGLMLTELRELILNGLKPDYLLDPRVTVQVNQYRDFFVNGEVQKPGGFPWQPGLTVRKAAALAGGFTERASRSRLNVIRDADRERKSVPISIDDPVSPGDIITIDQSFF